MADLTFTAGTGKFRNMSTSPDNAKIFQHAIRVPYAHTDQMRYVYYANYLVYFEMARSAMLREVGLPYGELEAQGLILPVIEAHCDYKTPAHYDDLLTVTSRCEIKGVRLVISYEITRDADAPTIIATGYTVHVCLGRDGRVTRPPAELRQVLVPTPLTSA
jgi:acyl-CoA thioester hydrolase